MLGISPMIKARNNRIRLVTQLFSCIDDQFDANQIQLSPFEMGDSPFKCFSHYNLDVVPPLYKISLIITMIKEFLHH